MAQYTNIFVDSQVPLEDFVRELESLLAIRFRSREQGYEYSNTQIALWVEINSCNISTDLNLDDYRYQIDIKAYNAKNEEERKERREDFARHVFEKLKETKSSPLMLVDDLQSLMDEYTPEGFSQPSVLMLKARTLPSDTNLYVGSAPSPEILYQDLKDYFQAQGLEVGQSAREGRFLLPTMSVSVGRVQKIVIHNNLAKTSKEISPAPTGFSYKIGVLARVQLPGGLAVPGERRYWVSELMMRLFEHLKVLGRYRLLLRDEAEDRDFAVFDPCAAEETPGSLKTL